MVWVRARLWNYKKGCTWLAATSDKVYQLLAHGLWFSPGTPASSTTKTGRHDIAEILLKVALNTKNQINTGTISANRQYVICFPSFVLDINESESLGFSNRQYSFQYICH